MTYAVLKERSNHSAFCAPWLVTTVDQKTDTGQILDTRLSHTGLGYRVAVLHGKWLKDRGLEDNST